MSVVGSIVREGKEIHQVELGVELGDGHLGSLVTQLRHLQEDTNKFLTQLIEKESSGDHTEDKDNDDDEEDDDTEEEEPEAKVPKLQN